MGFMTTINFLNDSYGDVEAHPEQVIQNILNAMNNTRENMKTYSIGGFCNPMTASRTEHADVPRLYLCWRNSFVEMGTRNDVEDSMVDVRKRFLEQAKRLVKEEEEAIKKIEGQMNIDVFDLNFDLKKVKQFGKYKVKRDDWDGNYSVFENSICIFTGKSEEVISLLNKQVPQKNKSKKSEVK